MLDKKCEYDFSAHASVENMRTMTPSNDNDTQVKICTKCGTTKSLNEFHKRKGGKFDRAPWCRDCVADYGRNRYADPDIKKKISDEQKAYYVKNKTAVDESNRQWAIDNRERSNATKAAWALRNPEKRKAASILWNRKNPEAHYNATIKYIKKKRSTPHGRLDHAMSSSIIRGINGGKSGKTTFAILGFTPDQLRSHLECQFIDGMSWNNYGAWHVDHIRPLVSFDYSGVDDPQFQEAWALSNLQPLWAIDNLRKGSKWSPAKEAA